MVSDKYISLLKKNGISNTASRRAIFTYLDSVKRPVTMHEIVNNVRSVDRVSCYRIIDVFEKIGIVNRISIGWKYKIELSDIFKAHHHHMTCTGCGDLIDFEEPNQLVDILEQITSQKNFALKQHTIELRGLCAKCHK